MQEASSNTFTPPHPLKTAVLFLIFNRPDTTKQVFEAIRHAKPPRLYVAADGPRVDKPGEEEKVEQTRRIATQVDWDCEVKTLFREENLGCGKAVSNAITWFFENEEEGIILEDDCLPSQSFFWFCEELLERYREEQRVMHINGNNFGASNKNLIPSNSSYHFCHYPQAWGWATWKRAWELFDFNIRSWRSVKENGWLKNSFLGKKGYKLKKVHFDLVYNGLRVDIWDYQWHFCVFLQSGLAISPKVNLISNIGFSQYATHTTARHVGKSALSISDIVFPLRHPEYVIADYKLDTLYREMMIVEPFWRRVQNKVKKILLRS